MLRLKLYLVVLLATIGLGFGAQQLISVRSLTQSGATSGQVITWNGTYWAPAPAGGLPTLGSANQVLGINNADNALEYKTLTGTSNEISVTHSAGAVTFATPQAIHTGASPTFAGMNLSGLTASVPVVTDASKNLLSMSYATFTSNLSSVSASVKGLIGAYPNNTTTYYRGDGTYANLSATAFAAQSANVVLAGPSSAGPSVPTWRAFVPLDWAASAATGGIPYSSSSTADAWIAAGTNGSILQMGASVPGWTSWTMASPGSTGAIPLSNGTNWTNLAFGANNQFLYGSGGTVAWTGSSFTYDGTSLRISNTAPVAIVRGSSSAGGIAAGYSTANPASGTLLGYLGPARGTYGSTVYDGALIEGFAAETWSGSAAGTDVDIYTTGTGTTSIAKALLLSANKNVVMNPRGSAISTGATDGFPYIPNMAGLPTGTPTTYTGATPGVYDTTNHAHWIYDGGWVLASGGAVQLASSGSVTINVGTRWVECFTAVGVTVTLTLPAAAPYAGQVIYCKKTSTVGTMSIPSGYDTSAALGTATVTAQYQVVSFGSDGTTWTRLT